MTVFLVISPICVIFVYMNKYYLTYYAHSNNPLNGKVEVVYWNCSNEKYILENPTLGFTIVAEKAKNE